MMCDQIETEEDYNSKKERLLKKYPAAKVIYIGRHHKNDVVDEDTFLYIAGKFLKANIPIREQIRKIK